MHSIPTVLRGSKSWSNPTQRSEYDKNSNWIDFNVNIEKRNKFSNSIFNGSTLNTEFSRSCKDSNLVYQEKNQINQIQIKNSLTKNENSLSKQKIANTTPIKTNCNTFLIPNCFSNKGLKNIPFSYNSNGFGAIEMEIKHPYLSNSQANNKKFTFGLNYYDRKTTNSPNNNCQQYIPIGCKSLFRATSFLDRKPNLNYYRNKSSFSGENSNFISNNFRSSNIKTNNQTNYFHEKNYCSNNLSNQLKYSYLVNQENSTLFLNKPNNSKIPNFLNSKFYIRNLPKVSINKINSKSEQLNNFELSNVTEINLTKIRICSLLGIGSTSLVYSAFWRGTEVAVKILGSCAKEIKSSTCDYHNLSLDKIIQPVEINKQDSQRCSEFKNEIRIMNLLRHPNIVQYMGGSISSNPPFLICEFCSGGTLFSLLHGNSKKCLESSGFTFSGPSVNLSLYQRIKILQDIARGIHFLHSANPPVIHRDIKSLNIFLSLPVKSNIDVPVAKVGDLGLCQQLLPSNRFVDGSGNLVGTYQWMAPEVLLSQIYNEYIDVYSFGMIMYEVLSNKTPFFELGINVSPEILADEIIRGTRPTLKYVVSDAPIEIKNIMMRCWDPQPSKRGSMLTIINELQHLMEKIIN